MIALFCTAFPRAALVAARPCVPIAVFGVPRAAPGAVVVAAAPLAVVAWALVHASGVHATVAGCCWPSPCRSSAVRGPAAPARLGRALRAALRPVSAGFAVPVFALFAAGVTVGGSAGSGHALATRSPLGIVAGLVVGKAVGHARVDVLLSRFTRARLDDDLAWVDVFGIALLAGLGFTVSLLIGELAFGPASLRDDHVKIGVLVGSVAAALLATVVLHARDRVYRASARTRNATTTPTASGTCTSPPPL